MKITKFNKENGEAEIINTHNFEDQIDNDIVVLPVQEKIIKIDKPVQEPPKAEVKMT